MKKMMLIGSLLLSLTACKKSVNFVSLLEIPDGKWGRSEWIEFDFFQTDPFSLYDIGIFVRHDPNFKFDKLRLEVRTIGPNRKFWCDTINVQLEYNHKHWLGRDMTTHYDLNTVYRHDVKFTRQGDYNIRIRQLSPADTLRGIRALGLTVEKNGKK